MTGKKSDAMQEMIHQTAIISEKAVIGQNVHIGAYCVIGDKVNLADNVTLHSHVVIDGNTSVGENCEVFPFAALGLAPQHTRYDGEDSQLIIGKNNVIREYVTFHPGTALGHMKTVIGDGNLFYVGSHIAHDCIVGNNVILANHVNVGGHVDIGDYAYFGGNSAVHPFIRIGSHSIIPTRLTEKLVSSTSSACWANVPSAAIEKRAVKKIINARFNLTCFSV